MPRARGRLPLLVDEYSLSTASTMPYRMLSGLFLLVAASAGILAIPSETTVRLRQLDVAIAIVLPVLAVVAWHVLPRISTGLGLDAACFSFTVLGLYGLAVAPTDASEILIGLGLALVAVFAAYFLPPYRFTLQLLCMLVGFAITTAHNAAFESTSVGVVATSVIATLSVTVARLSRKLREAALTDPLTGMHNRAGLFHLAELARHNAVRAGNAVTVGIFDLDDLKQVNDVRGHSFGDALIRDVAGAWQSSIRGCDVLARIGGDEFALILPGTLEEGAYELASRVRASHRGEWSAGFASWRADECLDAAIRRADAAMYRVKQQRREARGTAAQGV